MADVQFAIEAVKRVRYYIEPTGSYAVNGSGSVTYSDIRTTSAEMTLTQEFLDNMTMQQLMDAAQPKIRSRRRCEFNLGSYLVGTNVAVSGAQNAVTSSNSDLIGTIMGAIRYTTGSQIAAGAITTSQFAESSIFDKFAGTAIGVVDSSTGRMECVRVKSTGASGMLFEHKLPFTPLNGAPIYGSTTCHFSDDPSNSLQFYVQGQDHHDAWVLMGLQGNFTFSFVNGELITVTYALAGGANWNSGSADQINEANFVDGTPIPVVDARCIFYPVGTSTTAGDYVSIDVAAFELTPAIKYVDITTPKGVNNILRKRRSRQVPVAQGSVTAYYHDTQYFVDRESDRRYGLSLQFGSTPGNTVLITAPYCQLTDVKRVDAEEKAGVQIMFDVLDNKGSTITSGNRELARSAFSVHFL